MLAQLGSAACVLHHRRVAIADLSIIKCRLFSGVSEMTVESSFKRD